MEIIKKTSVDAVNAGKPTAVLLGNVTETKPLRIRIDQKITLGEGQLLLSRNVTDYTMQVLADWETEEGEGHTHKIQGEKEIAVENHLKQGETVLLIREAGGQRYIVWDRVVL